MMKLAVAHFVQNHSSHIDPDHNFLETRHIIINKRLYPQNLTKYNFIARSRIRINRLIRPYNVLHNVAWSKMSLQFRQENKSDMIKLILLLFLLLITTGALAMNIRTLALERSGYFWQILRQRIKQRILQKYYCAYRGFENCY